ncbi:putative Trichohyalin [Danaus plexippus plexippus]|uniref:Trichohyalin n=1 Tax=Danaus plexippus plexippus TaxID=278856 RepID=A0A212FFH5_DANPL|nr:putative Trichohyalin [Danaus plexippus plexippus]
MFTNVMFLYQQRKSLVNQETQFQSQVTALTELADKRCTEAEHARELIVTYRKEIEEKEKEIHQLKCDIASAYKECELVRQRSRSIEEDLVAARRCTAELADEMQQKIEEAVRQLRLELDEAHARRLQLEERVRKLEEEKQRLEQEKLLQQQSAKDALEAAEANTAKWRSAHEAARSQAAARAERILADCEWKMRELEKRARDVEKEKKELSETVEKLKSSPPTPSHMAELQQLRGLASEQQRSVQSLALQLQKVETREEELKLEVHRLKDLLEKEARSQKEREELHLQAIARLEEQHTEKVTSLKNEHAEALASAASARAALERAHAERTRAALAQLREEAERDVRNGERKLRELNTRFENLKEVLASKEAQFESAIAEAHSKADWDILQLRHLLDKADITYANNVEAMNERFEREKAQLIEEWSEKLREVEEQAATSAEEAKNLLQVTRQTLVAEKMEQLNKLKEKHRLEMDEQWEHFMTDKEMCLERMKMECRQEGEEEREKRERELLEEVAELKSRLQSQMSDYEELSLKAAACGRTLAVTEQELSCGWVTLAAPCACVLVGSLRLALATLLLSLALIYYIKEALDREKELRDKRGEDAEKMKLLEKKSRDQIEHLTRKCACLRKLFDDMRTRLASRERVSEQEARAKDKEIQQLKSEVARLTKLLMEQSGPTGPTLGARTRADGCESFLCSGGRSRCEETQDAPRRKGGTLKTPEMTRKRTLPELQPLPPEARRNSLDVQNGRRRAKSVDLPAVQVPVRIKQLEEKTQQ